jgi:hypothetical protein
MLLCVRARVTRTHAQVDVYSFAMVCWEIMAEKQPFHEVKRVWDLPRIVVEGLRPVWWVVHARVVW